MPPSSEEFANPDEVHLTGALSGEAVNLIIDLENFTELELEGSDDEIGETTINGVKTTVPTPQGEAVYTSWVVLPARFNASDGKRLIVHDVGLESQGDAGLGSLGSSATGPITAVKAGLSLSGPEIGAITAIESGVFANGNVASLNLDSASTLAFSIGASGSTAGTDYTQTTSTGAIGLNGASLEMTNEGVAGEHEFSCPPPNVGQVYTLIATTASLTGTFSNAAEGATIDTSPCAAIHKNGEPYNGRVYRYSHRPPQPQLRRHRRDPRLRPGDRRR